MKISPARIASFEILVRIEREKAFSSSLLPIYEENLSSLDRALCHELTLGTLRQQIYLDCIIGNFVTKKLDLEVRIALRLAIYQIYFLDRIPVYSAINESVNLVQKAKKTSAKGLVNAILRKISQQKVELDFANHIEQISLQNSHPKWLIDKWITHFGIEETAKLAAENNVTPEPEFRWTAKTTPAIIESLNSENISNKRNFLRELADNGKIYFQDKASQIVAETVDLQPGEKFLDVCSAPASKLSLIATTFTNQTVFGGDFYHHRLQTAKKSCQKQGLKNVQLLQYDAEKSLPFADESFDVVLVDAPCSGTGTIRHNPEIRYFLQPEDFVDLAFKQSKILTNSAKLIKKGGRLIYSTCSLEVEENEQIIENFLKENSNFEVVAPIINQEFLTEKGFARTLPSRDKIDGFFIAVLRKEK